MPIAPIIGHARLPTILPQQILEPTTPFGRVNENGEVIIDQTWFLFLYNLGRQSLSVSGAPVPVGSVSPITIIEDTDTVPANVNSSSTLIWLDV
jgi:hypothetical protein